MATLHRSIATRPSQDPARASILEAKVAEGYVLTRDEAIELSWIWIARHPNTPEYRIAKHLLEEHLKDLRARRSEKCA